MPENSKDIVAFIPARAGSKRVPGKNIRMLRGHPLIAYTIGPALESGVFKEVVVSTDSEEVAEIARSHGASVPFMRPSELSGDKSPDIGWVLHGLAELGRRGRTPAAYAILRPTSPFRAPETMVRARDAFLAVSGADSLRAVELCKQHPAKMWVVDGPLMRPLLDDGGRMPPWHSSAYQSLPQVYAQNASLEIAWSRVPLEMGTIAGKNIVPFFTEELEGFDINKEEDWLLAETLIERCVAVLPRVGQKSVAN